MLIYIDDMVVFSKSVEEHMKHLRRVLTLIKEAVLNMNLKKCKLFSDEKNYLGHVIGPGLLEIAEHMSNAVLDLKD